MAIIVLSPYSGKPVKIRDQDIGRTVRDEEKRVFYVLRRSDGKDYYAALTRQGGAKDEARYMELLQKVNRTDTNKREQLAEPKVHNAAGQRRSHKRGKVLIIGFAVILAALGWWAYQHKDQWQKGPEGGKVYMDHPVNPAAAPATPSQTSPTRETHP